MMLETTGLTPTKYDIGREVLYVPEQIWVILSGLDSNGIAEIKPLGMDYVITTDVRTLELPVA
jgi:hypothetical protein